MQISPNLCPDGCSGSLQISPERLLGVTVVVGYTVLLYFLVEAYQLGYLYLFFISFVVIIINYFRVDVFYCYLLT